MRMTIAMVRNSFPKVQQTDTDTLQQWIEEAKSSAQEQQEDAGVADEVNKKSQLLLLDCRPQQEFEISCIPGAFRVDPDEQNMDQVKQLIKDNSTTSDPEKLVKVIMYCSVGYRSSAMATRLYKASKIDADNKLSLDIYNLEGSIFKWANENRPLVTPSGDTTRFVHPYSVVWGRLLDADRRKSSPN